MREKTTTTVHHNYPGLVALVTAEWNGTRNIMAAGWHSWISYQPPMVGVAIGEARFTHHLIKNSGQFAIHFVPAEFAAHIQQTGVISGRDGDKFEALGIEYEDGETVSCPILKQAYVAYECHVHDIRTYGDHDWIVGAVQLFYKDPALFQENGLPDFEKLNIPLYVGRSQYLIADPKATIRDLHKP